jgi:hypothetical protein
MNALVVLTSLIAAPDSNRPCVLIVVGAPGTPEYAGQFRKWADQWQAAAVRASAEVVRLGDDAAAASSDHDRLRAALHERSSQPNDALWIVLIGHGSDDGHEAKFNLRGPDVTSTELALWLKPIEQPLAVLDCASASGRFLRALSAPRRIVVTATRSGQEQNFARFGQYLAEAITDPRADLDKDGQVSLLEAYLTAGSGVAEYYRTRNQLATEHALLDDNGDKLGTPPDWFRGVRATKRASDGAAADGLRAHQLCLIASDRERAIPPGLRQRRDAIELAIAALRDKKAGLAEDDYYAQLEKQMIELGRLYAEAGVAR